MKLLINSIFIIKLKKNKNKVKYINTVISSSVKSNEADKNKALNELYVRNLVSLASSVLNKANKYSSIASDCSADSKAASGFSGARVFVKLSCNVTMSLTYDFSLTILSNHFELINSSPDLFKVYSSTRIIIINYCFLIIILL